MYKNYIVAVLTVLCFRGMTKAVPINKHRSSAIVTKQKSSLKIYSILGGIYVGLLAFGLIWIEINDKIRESSDEHKKFLEYKKECEGINELDDIPSSEKEMAKQRLWAEYYLKNADTD